MFFFYLHDYVLYMHCLPSPGSWCTLWTALVLLWTSSSCTSWQLLCFHSLVSAHTQHTHTHTAFNDMHVYVAHTPLHQYHTYEHTCMSSKCSQMNALYTLKRFHVNTFSFTGFYLYGTGNNIVSDHLKALSFESLTSILGKEPFYRWFPLPDIAFHTAFNFLMCVSQGNVYSNLL